MRLLYVCETNHLTQCPFQIVFFVNVSRESLAMIFLVSETYLFHAGVHFKASHETFDINNE